MRLSLKFTILAMFSVLFLMQTVAVAQKAKPTGEDTKKNSEIIFPDIAGWEKGDTTTYPKAELGYSISYKSYEGGTVTIYVYNGGRKEIPDGIAADVVKAELKRAEKDIKAYGEQGYYDNVKLKKSDTLTLGGSTGKVESLRTLFNFEIRGNAVSSEIYVFGQDNNFIKIRATRPLDEKGKENKVFVSLLAEVDKIFAK